MKFFTECKFTVIAYRKLFWNFYEIQYYDKNGRYNYSKVWFCDGKL
jgi:uncharacterized protein YpmB